MFERRHYWRHVSFSELAELYASRTLRMFALSMVTVFIGIYLYKNGYAVTFIMLYFALYFVYRSLLAIPAAFVIAKIGPKYATLVSNFLYVPALLCLVMIPEYGFWALTASAFFQGVSVTLYDIAYLVGFSKVKNDDNAGKEISYMHIFEILAKATSPVVGGFVAYWVSPQATLFFAAGIFMLAALPLFFSAESVLTNQKITFRGVPWRRIRRNIVSQMSIGIDVIASGLMWSLFVAIAVFGTASNAIYAQLGVLASVSVFVGIAVSRVFGSIVDKRRGNELLSAGVIGDSLTHVGRILTATPFGVVLINIFHEIVTLAYVLPYTKGMFAQADDLPGYRIVFMTIMSISSAMGAAVICAIVAVFSLYLEESMALQAGYVVIAFTALLILNHGFRKYLRPAWYQK